MIRTVVRDAEMTAVDDVRNSSRSTGKNDVLRCEHCSVVVYFTPVCLQSESALMPHLYTRRCALQLSVFVEPASVSEAGWSELPKRELLGMIGACFSVWLSEAKCARARPNARRHTVEAEARILASRPQASVILLILLQVGCYPSRAAKSVEENSKHCCRL